MWDLWVLVGVYGGNQWICVLGVFRIIPARLPSKIGPTVDDPDTARDRI